MTKRLATGLVLCFIGIGLAACPAFLIAGSNALPFPGFPPPPVALALEQVVGELNRPVYLTAAPDVAERLFIVEQEGRILVHEAGALQKVPFLDLTALVGSIEGERGLNALAFHPDHSNNGFFYVGYTDTVGTTVFARYQRRVDNPLLADPGSAVIVLSIPQPENTHNGGMLAFGADGYLYLALGDGGGINDPDGNAQSLSTLLGKILRIDVDRAMPYAVPPDNPFVGVAGAREEIWAYGLRNPWRMSFDRMTGDLWIADVGQFTMEEINFQSAESPGGENYGWRVREGTICRPGETECDLPGAVDPLYAYARFATKAIAGGYVYRGQAIPDLSGTYFFSDIVSGLVFSLRRENDGTVTVASETQNLQDGQSLFADVVSFGEDGHGELYLVDNRGGTVYKMVAG